MSTDKITYDYNRCFNSIYDRISHKLETDYLNSTIPRERLVDIAKMKYTEEMSKK